MYYICKIQTKYYIGKVVSLSRLNNIQNISNEWVVIGNRDINRIRVRNVKDESIIRIVPHNYIGLS